LTENIQEIPTNALIDCGATGIVWIKILLTIIRYRFSS
jgi:hypothetical protein